MLLEYKIASTHTEYGIDYLEKYIEQDMTIQLVLDTGGKIAATIISERLTSKLNYVIIF